MKLGIVFITVGIILLIDMGIRAVLVGIVPALTGLLGIPFLYWGIKRLIRKGKTNEQN